MSGQHHAPAAFTPGKDPVPIVQEAGWAPEPAWIGAGNLAPPGFDPRTFQPVASRYTDYAIPAPAAIVSEQFFIVPTDAHNYKIIGTLKTIKIPTIAPTCFGSRRNHHQGAISCLAETTIMILLCSSLMTWSMLWRHTSCNKRVYLE